MGMPALSTIPRKTASSLPAPDRESLRQAKHIINDEQMTIEKLQRDYTYNNNKGPRAGSGASPLPRPGNGCQYFEFRAGEARANDPVSTAGKRRFVIEVNVKAREIRRVFYTIEHYAKGSFFLIV